MNYFQKPNYRSSLVSCLCFPDEPCSKGHLLSCFNVPQSRVELKKKKKVNIYGFGATDELL